MRILEAKASESGKKNETDKKNPEKDRWHDEWMISYKQMPSIVKMTVEVATDKNEGIKSLKEGKKDSRTITFSFVLPSSKNPVHYPPITSTVKGGDKP